MRHIDISEDELHLRVEAQRPGWSKRAEERTKTLCKQRLYVEESSIWSEIKPVFMTLQHNKCAFCERLLEGEDIGTIEHDIEHFRPKGPVVAWPTPEIAQRLRYRFFTGDAHSRGYYALAYSLLNYVTACKPCNTMLKASYFPIAGRRCRKASRQVVDYAGEEPLLIYPLGDVDVPPESLITFDGIFPVPVAKRGIRRRRAVVTIDFFRLDVRQDLLDGRAERLAYLYFVRQKGANNPDAAALRRALLSSRSPHSSCTRAFDALYDRDRARATRMYEQAKLRLPI